MAPRSAPDGADAEAEADQPGGQVQAPAGEDHDQRAGREREVVDRGRAAEDAAQHPVVQRRRTGPARASCHSVAGVGALLLGGPGRRRPGDLDPADEQRRPEERQRVGEQRDRRGQRLHQRAAQGGAGDEGRRAAGAQLAVRVEVVGPVDEQDEEGRVRRVEQHRRRAGEQRDDVQLDQRDAVEGERDRHGEQEHRPEQVGDHQQPLLVRLPVDPRADEHRRQVGQPHQRGEHRDLARRRVQHQDGDQRERQLRDPVAELGHGVGEEERPERAGQRSSDRRPAVVESLLTMCPPGASRGEQHRCARGAALSRVRAAVAVRSPTRGTARRGPSALEDPGRRGQPGDQRYPPGAPSPEVTP